MPANFYRSCSQGRTAVCSAAIFGLLLTAVVSAAAPIDGNRQIRATANDSTIVITTTRRLAGAIDSLQWNGHEFINSADHGRQLQSACSFDNPPAVGAETFNPTEAGSRDDGAGGNTISQLLEIAGGGNHLHTRTQMAFWLAPGERSGGQLARNTRMLSYYILTKDVTIGFGRWPQALDYRVTFSVPTNAHHVAAQFEALTGYMPPEFSQFWKFDPATGKLQRLTDGPGEIKNPVVLATPDGKYAMGIFAAPLSPAENDKPSYGRFKFSRAKVVKWNCVYRFSNPKGIHTGDYSFRLLVPVGTLVQVEGMLRDWRDFSR